MFTLSVGVATGAGIGTGTDKRLSPVFVTLALGKLVLSCTMAEFFTL